MRWMGTISALLTLVAVAVGVTSVAAFGFDFWELVVLLAPVGIGVALFSLLILYLGKWSARWLPRDEDGEGD